MYFHSTEQFIGTAGVIKENSGPEYPLVGCLTISVSFGVKLIGVGFFHLF